MPITKKRVRFTTKKPKPTSRKEWQLQAAIIAKFHELEAAGWQFTCAGDQNAARRGLHAAAIAKVTGMTAGEPDLRIVLPEGRIGWIELKASKGRLSSEQIARHARYAELGHHVHVLQAVTEQEAVEGAVKLLAAMLDRKDYGKN